jgi:glycosyltransferase involved in cell wall biosynthesis
MSLLNQITVLILTYNEAPNIGRTLTALSRFSDVVILDSGSTDGTIEIIGQYANVRYVTRPLDTHVAQWNHGLTSYGIQRPWVLALDADYILPFASVDEIGSLSLDAAISGYRLAFRNCVFGRPLTSTIYPPVVALYRRERTRYLQEGHTQRAVVNGAVAARRERIFHDDREPLSRLFASQQQHAKLEVDHLSRAASASLCQADKIRLMAFPAPILVFLCTLIAKRCILGGWAG